MVRAASIALFGIALAAPAVAGGLPSATPPAPVIVAPATSDWNGFYGGVQLEFGQGEVDYFGVPGGLGGTSDLDGALYGVFFGYREDFGGFILGTEFDYVAGDLAVDAGGIQSIDSIMRATLELGFDAGNAFLYGTAGIHATRVTTTLAINEDDWGAVFGLGADYRINDRMTVGAELLQHQLDDFSGSGAEISVTTFGVNIAFDF